MAPGVLFRAAGNLVLPCWLVLLIAPRWRWTQRIVTFVWPLLIAVLYVYLLTAHKPPPGSGFSSIDQVAALFSSPWALLAGWIHYLAFDLFIGAWETRDGLRLRISRWILLPCQVLTFLFGPAGLALYLLLKLVLRRGIGADDDEASVRVLNNLRQGWGVLRVALLSNRPMRLALGWQLILLMVGLLAMPFDHRVILGLNPWVKPMKFEISVTLYLLSMTPMLYGLRWHRSQSDGAGLPRSRAGLSSGFAAAMTVENTVIALQAARGVRSHMNYTSLLNGVLFGLMGIFIVVNTVLVAWLLILWCAAHVRTPDAVTWGVRLGLLTLLLGSVEGFLMVQHGGHTIGANDGLGGLPFVDWSRGHGDLRVAHFFALHALQAMPIGGLLLASTRLRQYQQVLGTWLFAGAYLVGVWWMFAQAMQGHPLLPH